MNKHLHRVVFNAARGTRMVVQETARSTSKDSGATPAIAAVALAAVLFATAASAQIAGDRSAPGNQRPTVLSAPNGVPLVNIQTPSAAGVSRNTYRQFDVNGNGNGAILNNSAANVQTQLGGWVQGNPWMGKAPARIILNEVNSANPSQLRGYVEVAGQRAEVIIANPAGIQVDGGGFINASRVTLTTGTPQFGNQGGLEGFLVRGGTVTVEGAGLDASETDYAAILARAVQANAGIWANDLKVVAGANQVSADALQATPTAGSGPAPTYALDVAQLGGMYAGKIVLVGTEVGLGVRNAGTIQAAAANAAQGAALAGAGQLVVTATGRLENTGTLQGAADTRIDADTLGNSGRISSGGNLRLSTQGDLANHMAGAGGTIEAQRLELRSMAGDIDNSDGHLRQTSTAGLTLTAPVLTNTRAGVIGAEPAPAGAPAADAGATPSASTATSARATAATSSPAAATASADNADPNTITPAPYVPPSPGTVTAAKALRNDGGHIEAGGELVLQTPQIDNSGGRLTVNDLAVSGPRFSNAGGTLTVNRQFSANVEQFDNQGGTLSANDLRVNAMGDLHNQGGSMTSNGDATLMAGGVLDDAGGTVSAVGTLTLSATGALDNTGGHMAANQGLNIAAGSLDNSKGSIRSAQGNAQLRVAGAVINQGGEMGAAGRLDLRGASLANGGQGTLRASGDLDLTVNQALMNNGRITAGHNLNVAAGSIQSGASSVLGAGAQDDGTLAASGDLTITATQALVANGTQQAAGQLAMQGASVDLSGSKTSAGTIAITATQGNVTTSGATVATPGTLSVKADTQPSQALINNAGTLNAGALDLHASSIANTNGGEIAQTGTNATAIATTGNIDNSGGRIASNGRDFSLQATTLTNTAGTIEHASAGTLNIKAQALDGAEGHIAGNGALVANISGALTQDQGAMSAEKITIDAGALSTRGGSITQTGSDATRITVGGLLDNAGGTLGSNGNSTVTAGSLANQGGKVRAAGAANLDLGVGGALDNRNQGEIGAGGNTTLRAGSLDNDAGRVTAGVDVSVTVAGAASNVGGTIAGNGNATVHADTLDNTGGTVAAVNGNLRVQSTGITNNAKGKLIAGGDAKLINAGLDNDGGSVFGATLSIDTQGNALTNRVGTLAASTTVNVHSGALNNDAGLIRSEGAMSVDTHDQRLSNTHAAGYVPARPADGPISGGVSSGGTLDLAAGNVDNTAGVISAEQALTARTAAFSNQGGQVAGRSAVAINTQGATFDNSGGQTLGKGELAITAGAITNTGGLIRSAARTTLNAGTTGTIGNIDTQGADQGIEGQSVAMTTGQLDNTRGAIRANADATITSAGTVNNSSGSIGAVGSLTIADPYAANPTAKTLNIVNTNGTLKAEQSVRIDAANFNVADGTLGSGRDLAVALTQDVVNNADLGVSGSLGYTTTGNFTNNAKLSAGDTLTVGGNAVDNTAAGEMSAANGTTVNAGTLTNRGLVDSNGETRINAGTVNNIGTGRIYGDHVAIAAGTLNNDTEAFNGQTKSATIASRGGIDLGVTTLNNREHALIFAAGELHVGGALDANGLATGKAAEVNNLSASIESLGSMSLAAGSINNLNMHFALGQTQSVTGGRTTVVAGDGTSMDFTQPPILVGKAYVIYQSDKGQLVLERDNRYVTFIANDGTRTAMGRGWTQLVYDSTTTTTDTVVSSDPARIVAGGDMSIDGLLHNHDSQVLAGGTLTATQAPDNKATTGTSVEHSTGDIVSISGTDTSGDSDIKYAMSTADKVTTVDLSPLRYEEHLSQVSGKAPDAAHAASVVVSQSPLIGAVSAAPTGAAVQEVASAVAPMAEGGDQTVGTTAATATTGTLARTSDGQRPIPMVVRTGTPNASVPTASLFGIHQDADSHYLVETDPRFADRRTWQSSDYLLSNLGLDPNTTLKRLGDGFYEQKLIREQVAQLTGYRFLAGFQSDEEQYTALMNNGATFARQFNLTPGIGLSPAQMAQLTSDIVWLVEQTVTLPDGSTQKVLVPQVYVRVQPGDIDGSGALLSADRVILKNPEGQGGDLSNRGTIAGRTLVEIEAGNIENLGRIAGGSVALSAKQDINNIGGSITASNSATLTAGRDINIETTTRTQTAPGASKTHVDRVAGVYVSNPKGVLLLDAGNDVNLKGATLENKGEGSKTLINAGHDVNLTTVTQSTTSNAVFDARNYRTESSSLEVGSTIKSGGNVTLSAGNDINLRAAAVKVDGTLGAIAKHDIHIEAGEATHTLDTSSYGKSKGFLSSKSTSEQHSLSQSGVLASTLSGNKVVLSADNDVTVRGSHVGATDQLSVSAGRDIHIESEQEQSSQSSHVAQSKKGLSASVKSGVSWGSNASTQDQSGTSTTQIASTLGGASVTLDAGRDVQVIASNVLASKDIDITAGRNIGILAAQDLDSSTSSSSEKGRSKSLIGGLAPRQTMFSDTKASENGTGESSTAATSFLSANGGNLSMTAGLDEQYKGQGQGNITIEGADLIAKDKVKLTGNAVELNAATSSGNSSHHAQSKSLVVGAQLAGTLGSAITNVYDMAEQARHTEDERLKGALALKAGYDAYKLAANGALQNGIQSLSKDGTGGDPSKSAIGVSVSVQSSKSRSDSQESFTQQRGTSIQAGSIDITARETDITTHGAKLQAKDISLDAARDINLLAAQNTAQTQSTNSGTSYGGGVTVGFGSQNGIGFQGNFGTTKGKANGSEVSYDNTLVTATDSLKIKSGGDTNLIGGQAAGKHVKMDVGGNLNIESLQDETDYTSKQSSTGLSVSVCVPPICYGQMVTATVDYARQKVDHNYRSATGQSGIAAGDGGYDITVNGNTDLKGGAITSTAEKDKNSLSTASLTMSDLENRQKTNSSNVAVSLSYGDEASMAQNVADSAKKTALANLAGGIGLPEDNNEKSQTLSEISAGNIKITGTGNKDVDDKSNVNVATLTERDAATANGALVNTLTLQQAKEIPKQQQEAQERQRAAQLIGSVVANVIGDVTASLHQQAQDKEDARARAAGEAPRKVTDWADGSAEKILLHGLAGILQAKIGGSSLAAGGAAGAVNEVLLPVMAEYLVSQGVDPKGEEFKSLLTAGSTLIGAVTATAAGGTSDAGLGAVVANNATAENYLKHAELLKKAAEINACGADTACVKDRTQYWDSVSLVRNAQMQDSCVTGSATQCRSNIAEMTADLAELANAGTGKGGNLYTPEEANNLKQLKDKYKINLDRLESLGQAAMGTTYATPAELAANGYLTAQEARTFRLLRRGPSLTSRGR